MQSAEVQKKEATGPTTGPADLMTMDCYGPADVKTLLAKLKGFETLNELYRLERTNNRKLTEEVNTLKCLLLNSPGVAIQTTTDKPDVTVWRPKGANQELLPQDFGGTEVVVTNGERAGHPTAPPHASASTPPPTRDDDNHLAAVPEELEEPGPAPEGPALPGPALEELELPGDPEPVDKATRLTLEVPDMEGWEAVDRLSPRSSVNSDRDCIFPEPSDTESDAEGDPGATVAQELVGLNTESQDTELRWNRRLSDMAVKLKEAEDGRHKADLLVTRERIRADSLLQRAEHYKTKATALKEKCSRLQQEVTARAKETAKVSSSKPTAERLVRQLEAENDLLRQQVTIYQNDFDQERLAGQKAATEAKAAKTELALCRTSLHEAQGALAQMRRQLEEAEADKAFYLRRLRENKDEIRLGKQQQELLQTRLRGLEHERRHTVTYMSPLYPPQAASRRTWNCPACTLENVVTATRCAVCETPAPPPKQPLLMWPPRLECDEGMALRPRSGPSGFRELSGGPPVVQVDAAPEETPSSGVLPGDTPTADPLTGVRGPPKETPGGRPSGY